jgi:hypothetical protein
MREEEYWASPFNSTSRCWLSWAAGLSRLPNAGSLGRVAASVPDPCVEFVVGGRELVLELVLGRATNVPCGRSLKNSSFERLDAGPQGPFHSCSTAVRAGSPSSSEFPVITIARYR